MYVQQAVLLLHFLENLEKLMYNAYEGTATSLPPAIRVNVFTSICLTLPEAIQLTKFNMPV